MKKTFLFVLLIAILTLPFAAFPDEGDRMIEGSGGVSDGYAPYKSGSYFVTSPLYSDGTSVGIGTESPSELFHVKSGSGNNVGIRADVAAVGDDSILYLISGTSAQSYIDLGDTSNEDIGKILYDQASDYMAFFTNDAEQVRINSSGQVGIGTSSPSDLLEVSGPAGSPGVVNIVTEELTVVDGDKLGQIDFIATLESDGTDAILPGASIWAEADATFDATTNDTDLVFATGLSETATEKMRLDSSGNLTVTGYTLTKFSQIDKSADAVTLTALECSDTLITNRGWDGTDDQTFTLPDADTSVGAGLKFKLLIAVASGGTADTYIDTEGSTTDIYLDGVSVGDGERVWTEEAAVGESIVCHTATLDGTTYDWFCDSVNGTWADKGS